MRALVMTVAAVIAVAGTARAQAPQACPGGFQIVRTSKVKPGRMDAFLKAAHDQQAWYASKGLADRIVVGRVFDRERDGGAPTPTDVMMTWHTSVTSALQGRGDAGWTAFVAEYAQSADMTDERFVCVSPAG